MLIKIGMNQPFSYYGGKGKIKDRIIKLIPPHHTYVEVFGGSAGVMLKKERPSSIEVYNDLNPDVVNFFRVIKDDNKFEKFKKRVKSAPYSKKEYDKACGMIDALNPDSVERAYYWFVRQSMSRDGNPKAGFSNLKQPKKPKYLIQLHDRIKHLIIENMDFRELIPKYDNPSVCFYLDPPYYPSTRTSPNVYDNELTEKDYEELLNLILQCKGKCILSGYVHPIIYDKLTNSGWYGKDFLVKPYKAIKKEDLWTNFWKPQNY